MDIQDLAALMSVNASRPCLFEPSSKPGSMSRTQWGYILHPLDAEIGHWIEDKLDKKTPLHCQIWKLFHHHHHHHHRNLIHIISDRGGYSSLEVSFLNRRVLLHRSH